MGLEVALIGAGIGIFHPPNSSALIGSVPREMLGVASAITMMARNIGTSIVLAVAGAAYSLFESHHLMRLRGTMADSLMLKRTASVNAFHDTLLLILPIVAAGIFTSLMRGGPKGPGRK